MAKTTLLDRTGALPTHPIVVLTGFMGSGKTSTGLALAELLGWEFIDLDKEIEAHEGVAILVLFQRRGEESFRAIEREALARCLERCDRPTVISLGGGTFVQPNNAKTLLERRVLSVFLETPVEDMLQRCSVGEQADLENPRPLAEDTATFRSLYEKRLPSYRTAYVTITTAGKSVAEVAHEVAKKLGLKAEE